MQARGSLVQDEAGVWGEGAAIDWSQLPARVEGVIAERIRRLPEPLLETLQVASVEGERFTAEVVAWVLGLSPHQVVRQLSRALEAQHHLVQNQGSLRVGEQHLSHFRFGHNLFQTYLYNRLNEAERAYLHEEVGTVLETIYAGQTEVVADQLA